MSKTAAWAILKHKVAQLTKYAAKREGYSKSSQGYHINDTIVQLIKDDIEFIENQLLVDDGLPCCFADWIADSGYIKALGKWFNSQNHTELLTTADLFARYESNTNKNIK